MPAREDSGVGASSLKQFSTSSAYVLGVICFVSVFHIKCVMQCLVRLSHHDVWITRPHCGSIGVKYLFRGHNDVLTGLGTEPRIDNLAVINLRSALPLVGMIA